MKILFTLLGFLLYIHSMAQNPKYYIDSYGWSDVHNGVKILQKNNGQYLIGCSVYNLMTNKWNFHVLELNNLGIVTDTQGHYNDNFDTAIRDLIVINNSFFIVGFVYDEDVSSDRHSYFSFLDNENNYFNYTKIGNITHSNVMRACIQTADKGFLLAGNINPYDTIPNYRELYLIKLDSLGVEQWDTTYFDYDYNSWFTDIIPESDTTFILLGSVNYNYLGIGDVLVTKIDQHGNRLWSEVYDLGGEEQARECLLTQDGGIVFTAGSFGISPSSTIVKISQNGELVWSINNYFDGCGGARMIELVDSSLVFTGCLDIDDAPEKNQLQVVKLAANGDFQWSRLYGGDDDDYGYDIIINDFDPTGKSGYVLTGRTESNLGPGLANVYFLKLNCLGLLTEPQAHFEATLTDLSVQFTNTSQCVYPDSIDGGFYHWNFGDGTNSNALSPLHEYSEYGAYEVTLTAVVCNDTAVYSEVMEVFAVGIGATSQPSIHPFYPNPTHQTITMKYDFKNGDSAILQIFDVTGRLVHRHFFKKNGVYHLNVEDWAKGVYVYEVRGAEQLFLQEKLVVW